MSFFSYREKFFGTSHHNQGITLNSRNTLGAVIKKQKQDIKKK